MLFTKPAVLDTATLLSTQRLATRLSFFSLGFATAAWAPLIPFAQQRLNLNHADFGLLLLCMGIGSMIAMPATGALVKRWGCRPLIALALMLLMVLLPSLTMWSSIVTMAVALFIFGSAAGCLGVAINLQAVVVEKHSVRALMSSFHGMCSLGGLTGAMLVTALLAVGLSPLMSTLSVVMILLVIGGVAIPSCLTSFEQDEKPLEDTTQAPKKLYRPDGIILLIGMMCFIAFLSEGAAMDWGGIYLTSKYQLNPAFAGLAYTFFALSMTTGRFAGHILLKQWGEKNIVTYSAIGAAIGMTVIVTAPVWQVVVLGYALLGLGCSNIVPVMFSRVGRQNNMPKAAALSLVSTIAYTGSLSGPALIGLIGEWTGLSTVLTGVAVLLFIIALLNRFTLVKTN
ncbi:MFS transporter [Acinetobacter pittii]|uniref:MFS transporter n=1 Tax=Acinetobacter TaxID=469 RepID=UPI0003124B0F|nr:MULTISPECIES: MFS transporter [Acinetobacter]KCY57813.1 major Facilitator Superfamily protein [Acinetobacter baumannii 1288284]QNB05248.1 MFS transporter [Acinetobacter baumannii]AVN23882.1 MFS transporter [Acinetobacter pittii]EXA89986.1 major Facilitator Superfamily protein [Acinetobacter sp. 1289694]EXB78607.1 major Facilitator Superfamily protein [Acinetobacter sp. 1475718]